MANEETAAVTDRQEARERKKGRPRKGEEGVVRGCHTGEALRWIRETYMGGASRTELAERLGVVRSYVTMWESGSRALSEQNARRIAATVARNKEDEELLVQRLLMGVVRDRFPDVAEKLEFLHVGAVRSEPRQTALAAALREAFGPTVTDVVRRVSQILECHPRYAEWLLEGRVDPTEEELAQLAEAAGEPKEKWTEFVPTHAAVARMLGDLGLGAEGQRLALRFLQAFLLTQEIEGGERLLEGFAGAASSGTSGRKRGRGRKKQK